MPPGPGPGPEPPNALWRPWSRRFPPYPPDTAEDGGLQYCRGRRAPGGVRRIVPWSRRSPPYPQVPPRTAGSRRHLPQHPLEPAVSAVSPGTAEDGGLQAAFAALSPGAGGLRRIPRYRRGRRAPGGVRRIVPWSRRSPPYPPGTAEDLSACAHRQTAGSRRRSPHCPLEPTVSAVSPGTAEDLSACAHRQTAGSRRRSPHCPLEPAVSAVSPGTAEDGGLQVPPRTAGSRYRRGRRAPGGRRGPSGCPPARRPSEADIEPLYGTQPAHACCSGPIPPAGGVAAWRAPGGRGSTPAVLLPGKRRSRLRTARLCPMRSSRRHPELCDFGARWPAGATRSEDDRAGTSEPSH
jgi:hypothetical protein